MSEGKYEVMETGNSSVMAYRKYDEQDDFIILVNFSSQEQAYTIAVEEYSIFMNNYENEEAINKGMLRPLKLSFSKNK